MRAFNFSAGPAALPIEVLQQAASEMLDWRGTGISVMEMSHRGREYQLIHEEALADLRELLAVPDNYKILFMQGGGQGQNAFIPLNLLGTRTEADYIVTGVWSQKSYQEAQRYCRTHIAATTEQHGFTRLPAFSEWQLSDNPAYVHVCGNETINGVEFFDLPQLDVPLVVDTSSHLLSRPMDVTKYGVLYACAQKNFGIAGLTLVIVREDLLERALPICPSVFNWKTVAQNNSIYHTPPTYAIYLAGLVFKWLKQQGGLAVLEVRNREKAKLLYGMIDASDFYINHVEKSVRSLMNVPFHLVDETRTEDFLRGAREQNLLQLKGHSSVGGMRASLYNAVPSEAVQALVEYMREFERSA